MVPLWGSFTLPVTRPVPRRLFTKPLSVCLVVVVVAVVVVVVDVGANRGILSHSGLVTRVTFVLVRAFVVFGVVFVLVIVVVFVA